MLIDSQRVSSAAICIAAEPRKHVSGHEDQLIEVALGLAAKKFA